MLVANRNVLTIIYENYHSPYIVNRTGIKMIDPIKNTTR